MTQTALVRCTECLIPTRRPETEFENGICSACIAFKQRAEIDWDSRHQRLLRHLESLKPNGDGYHCVVPSSGGKDSHYQVLKLIDLGLRPLCITASTCMLSDIGAANIRNLSRHATTVEITPNLRVRALLNRLGLELTGDVSLPEHISIFNTPQRIAKQFGLSTLVYGECPQEAYGGPLDQLGLEEMDEGWVARHGGHLGFRPSDMVGHYGITERDMLDYRALSAEEAHGMRRLFLGAFEPWDSHRNARAAVEAGMECRRSYIDAEPIPPSDACWWSYENLDNCQTGLHDYFGFLKYGYNRCCAQISVDIRYGLISRDDAITIVRDRDPLFPTMYMGVHWATILHRIGVETDKFITLCHEHANRDLFDAKAHHVPSIKPDVWEASFV